MLDSFDLFRRGGSSIARQRFTQKKVCTFKYDLLDFDGRDEVGSPTGSGGTDEVSIFKTDTPVTVLLNHLRCGMG